MSVNRAATWLIAGPARVLLDGLDLRYLSVNGLELARRIYVAVRDEGWNTLRPRVGEMTVRQWDGGFCVTHTADYESPDVSVTVRTEIAGTAIGSVSYSAVGEFTQVSRYAKAGICVHHPTEGFIGERYDATGPASACQGLVPREIGRQVERADGTHHPLFAPFDHLRLRHQEGAVVEFTFAGDLWELEDHRNWSDSGLKSASTPAEQGYAHIGQPEDGFDQSVYISVRLPTDKSPARASATPELKVGPRLGRSSPHVGLFLPARFDAEDVAARVDSVRPQHLRIDVATGSVDWPTLLAERLDFAGRVGLPVELAVLVRGGDHDTRDQLVRIAKILGAAAARPRRALVYHEDEAVTTSATLESARQVLAPGRDDLLLCGGTRGFFAELNRGRPIYRQPAGVTWAVTPQVHGFDDRTLMENLEPQREQVRSALAFGNSAVFVGPISMLPGLPGGQPFGDLPFGTGEPRAEDLRASRQFGAAWLIGSYASLAGSGASGVTYDCELNEYLVPALRSIASLSGCRVRDTLSTAALSLAGAAFDREDHVVVLGANLTGEPLHAIVTGLPRTAASGPSRKIDLELDGWATFAFEVEYR